MQKIVLILCLITLSSCASLNTRNTIIRDMAIGALAGALVAQTKTENREAYTTMYAGIGAASAGVISAFMNVPDENKIQKENENLKAQVEEFEQQLKPKLIQKGNSLFSSPIPKEVAALVDPGEWKRYKLDQWVQDPNQSNTWYRQVEMFEITPPAAR